MKNIITKMNFWNLFIGVVVGFFLGVCFLSFLVPSGADMIRIYHTQQYKNWRSGSMMGGYGYSMMGDNRYMMSDITTEKQFVEDMIVHHQAAVTMANQVLKLNPRAEVKKLANDIISAQTSEINMMKDWITNWK